jgi:hypothetical protein
VVALALRRLRARRWRALGGAVAVAGAVGLVLAVSVLGALAREDSARGRVTEMAPRERLVQVTARERVELRGLELGAPVTARVGGPLSPGDERGTRVVWSEAAPRIVAGREPRSADEVLTLSVRPAIGDRVRLGRVRARVVGRARLARAVAPNEQVLHGHAVVVGEEAVFDRAIGSRDTWFVTSAALRPDAVRGTELRDLAARMRAAEARAERASPDVDVVTPAERLEAIDRRARAAQRRLLLVGAQGAALFLAFAALLGVARRTEAEALTTQLRSLGAARWQPGLVRLIEVALPAVAGAVAALAIAAVVASANGVLGAALPPVALGLVVALVAGAIAAEHLAASSPRRRGALEMAALVCLAAVAWQALATGGLDASQVSAGDAAPVLLLVPALALFAGGVLVARLLPRGFRLAERLARRRGVPTRLALLSLTRGGGVVAAATTFLALSLGGALFALDYRATLQGQLEAQAAFAAGPSWRVSAPEGVAPLTKLAGLTLEEPSPVMRLPALVSPGARYEDAREATLLALSDAPAAVRTGARPDGPRLDGSEVRMRLRATLRATIVLELLLPGEEFARLPLGDTVAGRWVRLLSRVPPRMRGGEIVGITVSSLLTPRASVIDAAPLEQRLGRWAVVDDLAGWEVAAGRFGDFGRVVPGPRGMIIDVPESDAPLIRPAYEVPDEIPAVASEALARIAVDGRLTAMVRGRPLMIRIAATSEHQPTITSRPDRFLVVDYATVLAVLTAQRPGETVVNEAWFDGPPPRGRAPYPEATIVSRAAMTEAARRDALAAGIDATLLVTAILAGALAAAGLLLAAASLLRSERAELAGWRAQGAGPAALARMKRVRVLALYVAGALAALAGAAIALRLVVALVAVTAGGGDPLPPIEIRIDWAASAVLIAATGAVAVGVARAAR